MHQHSDLLLLQPDLAHQLTEPKFTGILSADKKDAEQRILMSLQKKKRNGAAAEMKARRFMERLMCAGRWLPEASLH